MTRWERKEKVQILDNLKLSNPHTHPQPKAALNISILTSIIFIIVNLFYCYLLLIISYYQLLFIIFIIFIIFIPHLPGEGS